MKPFFFGDEKAKTVLIQPVDEHDLSLAGQELAHITEICGRRDILLAAVKTDDWNHDLSPWPAPPVFGTEGFGGGAAATLAYLENSLIPSIENKLPGRIYYTGGYSLAGLFALWAACNTDIFRGAAAASPSVWFPEFTDYMQSNRPHTCRIYLSLGDREEKTRNPVMATVGSSIREIYDILKKENIPCTLKWNRGNHFKDTDLRTARAFAWVLDAAV